MQSNENEIERARKAFCQQLANHILFPDLLRPKESRDGLRMLKSLAQIFQVGRLQSVLIFSIFSHPCSFMVYYYFFGVFLF